MLETKCVGDGFRNFAGQKPLILNISFEHQYSKDFTNIEIQSPLNSSQSFTSLSPLHNKEDFHFVCLRIEFKALEIPLSEPNGLAQTTGIH